MQLLQSLWRINPWLAAPVIFAIGIALLYVKWPVARISAVFFLVCGLLLAVSPGDPDNWWMAVCQVAIGSTVLVLFRPRWFRDRTNRKPGTHLRFSLRDLVIATGVFGLCLSFVLRAFQYRAEQSVLAQLVDPILHNYVSTVAFDDGQVRLLGTNNLPSHADPLYARARSCGFSHWYASDDRIKSFANQDLVDVANTHQSIQFLDLRQSDVTANGLSVLDTLELLEGLSLDPDQCSAAGIGHLMKLEKLSILTLGTTDAETLETLRQALPECDIQVVEK